MEPGLDQRSRSVEFLESVRVATQKSSCVLHTKKAGDLTTESISQDADREDGTAAADFVERRHSLFVTVVEAPPPPEQSWASEHLFVAPQ